MNEPNPSSPQTLLQPAPGTSSQGPAGVSRVFVSVAIAVVAVAFISFLAIIYVKSWLHRPAVANAILVVRGNQQFDGAIVTLRSDGSSFKPETIGAAGDYCCVFHIPPGEYRVRLEFRGGSDEREVVLVAGRIVTLPLGKAGGGAATTRKSAGADKAISGK